MEVLFVMALFGGIVGLIARLVRGHQRQVADAWCEAANQLGMKFEPGTLLRSKSIHGHMYDNRVEVDTHSRNSGRSSQMCTRYRVYFPAELGLDLHLKQKGLLTGVATFFGSQDIELGDPQFDAHVVVKGSDPTRVAELLTPSLRLQILRLFREHPGCEIKDHLLEWSQQGKVKQTERIVSTVRRLAFAASQIGSGEEPELTKSRSGVPGDFGYTVVPNTPSLEPPVPLPPVTEAELERQALSFGTESDDSDVEVESTAGPPLEIEPLEPEADEPTASEGPPAPAMAEPGPEAATLCDQLFASGPLSLDAQRLFDERYKGRSVRWTGELRKVAPYQIDLVFGGDPGTKMVLDMGKIGGGAIGPTVKATVQLPAGAADALLNRLGERITFEGRLLDCDTLMHDLFVADARLV